MHLRMGRSLTHRRTGTYYHCGSSFGDETSMSRQCMIRLLLGTAILASTGRGVGGGVLAQCQESRLDGPLGLGYTNFGWSVAISGDRAIVGAPSADVPCPNCDGGVALVFRHDGIKWVQEALLIAPDPQSGRDFGVAVAVDGDIAVCGGKYDNQRAYGAGAVYVYRRQGTNWGFETKLTAADASSNDFFGSSVAVRGNVIAAGAESADCCGAVYVFRNNAQAWTQEAKLTPADTRGVGWFGFSVDVDEDRIVAGTGRDDLYDLGCPSGFCYYGSAYVFHFDGTNWRQEQKLRVLSPVFQECFGASVDLHAGRILVGTSAPYGSGGSAYTFVRDANGWRQEHRFASSVAGFGRGVALTDGFALIGASPGGYLFRYDDQPGSWRANPDSALLPSDEHPGIEAIALNGTHAIIGAFTNKAYVFGVFEPPDENVNRINDACEADCNGNGIADAADVFAGNSADCDLNGIPDECEPDCNANGVDDSCDIRSGQSPDCNHNGVPDGCDILAGTSQDCSADGIPDECDPDCNLNGTPDSCDIYSGNSPDIDEDGTPDECERWSHCVSAPGYFDFGPHRVNVLAEFLGMLISGELRAPDAVYDRIVRDLALLDSTYPILTTVDRRSRGMDGIGVQLDLNEPHDEFDALSVFYQAVVTTPYHILPDWRAVFFCDTLNTNAVRSAYMALPEVMLVEYGPDSGYNYNGDYVDLTVEGDVYVYEFSNGEGDCMSGCFCRQNWRFALTPSGSISVLEYHPGHCGCGDYYTLPNDGDFDADGVKDCLDPCPAWEDPGPIDTDADGIGDICDACARTILGASVDASGCPARIPGDVDRDGDVGPDDFARLRNCIRGPSVSPNLQGCPYLDADCDVDLWDFSIFQNCFSGANIPADPACIP